MKKQLKQFLLLLLILVAQSSQSQIVINTDGSLPDSSAILDVQSTTQGLLLPRLTSAQRNAIPNPAAGLIIYNTDTKIIEQYSGTNWTKTNSESITTCGAANFTHMGLYYGTVLVNGRCWLDRNLGANQIARSQNDSLGFGYYFQWGRGPDGHQLANSLTRNTLAGNSTPDHDEFILSQSNPFDWQDPQALNLWTSYANYSNNPCPEGWKVPSKKEWMEVAALWDDLSDAYNSPLKITANGYRSPQDGSFGSSSSGIYWSSGIRNQHSLVQLFATDTLYQTPYNRAYGFAVRCIQVDANENLFAKAIGGASTDIAYSFDVTDDGGFILAGETTSFGSGWDWMVLKMDSEANQVWGNNYGTTSDDHCRAVLLAKDDGIILTGSYSDGALYDQMKMMKLTATGTIDWELDVGGSGLESGRDVIQDSDDGFVFVGETNDIIGAGGYDVYIRKQDNLGVDVWSWIYGQTGDEKGRAIIKDTDGGYAVAGYTDSFGGGLNDIYFNKLTASGTPDFSIAIGGDQDEEANDLVLAHDSSYVIAGYTRSTGAGSSDFYIKKIDVLGNSVWGKVIGGSAYDIAHSIIRTEDNGFAIVGETMSFGSGSKDLWLVKLDAEGEYEWSWTVGGGDDEVGYQIKQDTDGYFYACGYTESFGVGGYDFFIVKFAPDGGSCLGQYQLLSTGVVSFSPESNFLLTKPEGVVIGNVDDDVYPGKAKLTRGDRSSIRPTQQGKDAISPTSTTICN